MPQKLEVTYTVDPFFKRGRGTQHPTGRSPHKGHHRRIARKLFVSFVWGIFFYNCTAENSEESLVGRLELLIVNVDDGGPTFCFHRCLVPCVGFDSVDGNGSVSVVFKETLLASRKASC